MTASPFTPPSPKSLSLFPDELILHILSYLDIPDLLNASRVHHHIRTLSIDPLLHVSRLARASCLLEHYIPIRPPLSELMAHQIYITRTTLAARNLGRNLIKIKLNRSLLKRPSPESLVDKGVLPAECLYRTSKDGTGTCVGARWVAPTLIETKRRIEKEKVKDMLRHWVEEWRRKGSEMNDEQHGSEYSRPNVRRLARRFARESSRTGAASSVEVPRWGRKLQQKENPPRAKVLGLKRFWEKVGREGQGP
ncbi:hypothetical protein F5884DRAFT_667027 [Xylogone sp. PMI_703]|nr:hypothetical protein F5884DRAFT_667027 [Xylogone sp. PMI_703]